MIGIDRYTFKARLCPTVIILFPIILLFIDLQVLGIIKLEYQLIPLSLLFIGANFLAELARDNGKKLQPELFKEWGGAPTVQLLSYKQSNEQVKPILQRWHKKLKQLNSDFDLPTNENEEAENLEKYKNQYNSVATWLKEQTRDTNKFSLLFNENMSYGFRRNLLGLKLVGFGILIFSFGINIWQYITSIKSELTLQNIQLAHWLILGLYLAFLFFYVLVLKSSWVKIVAFEYSTTLLKSIEILEPPTSS